MNRQGFEVIADNSNIGYSLNSGGVSAKVIEDSINSGVRLTTLQLRYQRFIHSEFMTHRVFSRNASSSRAIPVKKMLAQVWNDPASPTHWGANQPGMQAKAELQGWRRAFGQKAWNGAGKIMCGIVWTLDRIGAHKQWANRLLEPWQYISVIVTATDWDNFVALRCHEDAQPEFKVLADLIDTAMSWSTPFYRGADATDPDCWHLPYVSYNERATLAPDTLVKLSAARCARVSYLTHDGQEPSAEADIKLFDRLVGSTPLHASPIEHQAYPIGDKLARSNNFRGWHQFRAIYEAKAEFAQPSWEGSRGEAESAP